ncbi:MAG: SsrA-binding protein SmpB, partial [Bacteroidales bacterium]|nr:SsrA-binding protein SmpB [Bacteroidales bacterium]
TFDYCVEEKLECGIELKGTEVKSIRLGKASIKEAWVAVEDGELIIHNMHISPYEMGSYFNQDPIRNRRLLAHKREIRKLAATVKQDGMTLIPLRVYLANNGLIKVELGVCKGKKNYDKRQTLKAKDAKREVERSQAY